jgi:hypothetical protein
MPLREDDVARRIGAPGRRTLLQAGGFALAITATLAVFLTDNPQVLRLAVVGVAWAFVLATFAAGRRSTDRVAAHAREVELRRTYEFELEREATARREYELELETELRREAEESMRAELDALRDGLSGLTQLRDEVARVAALRDDVAALTSMRQELGQLAELRADMSRLRAELTEQLSSEMLVERIIMRTQAHRLPTEPGPLDAPGRTLQAAAGWADDVPPRELTGGWPAVRLDEPREIRQFDQARAERTPARPPVPLPPAPPSQPSWRPDWESDPTPRPWETPATASWESVSTLPWQAPATASWESSATGSRSASPPAAAPPPAATPPAASASATDTSAGVTPLWSATARAGTTGLHARHGAAEPVPGTAAFLMAPPSSGPRLSAPPPPAASPVAPPPVAPSPGPEPLPSPLEWLAARSLIDVEPTSVRPEVPPRRRRGEEAPGDPATAATTQRPVVQPHPPIRADDRRGHRVAVREDQPAERPGTPAQEKRLADILAENGVTLATGGRRRRRYRDEDEPDDVLARVLGTT